MSEGEHEHRYRKYADSMERPKSNYSATKYHDYRPSYDHKSYGGGSAFNYASQMSFVQYRHHPKSQMCAAECSTALKKKSKKMHCQCKCKKDKENVKEIHTVFVQAPPTIIRETQPQPVPQQIVRYVSPPPPPQSQPVTYVRTSPVVYRTEVVGRPPMVHRVE